MAIQTSKSSPVNLPAFTTKKPPASPQPSGGSNMTMPVRRTVPQPSSSGCRACG